MRGVLIGDVHLAPQGPGDPEAEGADAEQEADQRQQVGKPQDLAVLDREAGSGCQREGANADAGTDRRAEHRTGQAGLQNSHFGGSDPLGGGWLPLAPGGWFWFSQSSSANRSLTTTVMRMSVWPKPHSSAHRPGYVPATVAVT